MASVFPLDLHNQLTQSLLPVYSKNEAEVLSYLVLEHYLGLGRTSILVNSLLPIETPIENKLDIAIGRLKNLEPIQHILGEAEFYGRKFKVNDQVLIPRQETEELIRLILDRNKITAPNILDIGTGSGCIACSLSLEIPQAKVTAIDISEEALEVAKQNAKKLQVSVYFLKLDILNEDLAGRKFDIIVSNPPYVLESEREQMSRNVLDYDPAMALFVPDEKPLTFYKAIAKKACPALNNEGQLYFEINEQFGSQVAALLNKTAYSNVEIHQDLNGKDRFVSGKFNSSV
ncbi:MAG: peptide chain release factor N(5)-glutamine methyltransferase [Cyclobacteriaceae bacterium]